MRVAEKAADEMTYLKASGILSVDLSHIDMSAIFFYVLYIALCLQDPNDRENGVVRKGWLLGKCLENIMDGPRTPLPQDIHDPQLRLG